MCYATSGQGVMKVVFFVNENYANFSKGCIARTSVEDCSLLLKLDNVLKSDLSLICPVYMYKTQEFNCQNILNCL